MFWPSQDVGGNVVTTRAALNMDGDASFCRSGSGEDLSELVMEFPAGISD